MDDDFFLLPLLAEELVRFGALFGAAAEVLETDLDCAQPILRPVFFVLGCPCIKSPQLTYEGKRNSRARKTPPSLSAVSIAERENLYESEGKTGINTPTEMGWWDPSGPPTTTQKSRIFVLVAGGHSKNSNDGAEY